VTGSPGDAAGHGLTGLVDAGAFLARLVRLDPAVLVRLRSSGTQRTGLWARLPFSVLVHRTVAGAGPGDATVSAVELLAEVARGGRALPGRHDPRWRWPLPPGRRRIVEAVTVGELRRVAEAAAGTLRAVAARGVDGRAVGQRTVRDALLDHVAIVVTGDLGPGALDRIEVSQRLVQAVARMGFTGGDEIADEVRVPLCLAGAWIGLIAPYGVAWLPGGENIRVSAGRQII